LKQKFIILTILTFWSFNNIACSCGELTKLNAEEYKKAGDIFIGKVLRVVENRDQWVKAVTFEIIDQLKSTQSKKEITIWTALDGAACGLSTIIGDRWYIFSYYNDNGQLRAGLCGRSVNLDKKFKVKYYGLKYAYLEKKAWKKEIKRYKQEKRFIRKLKTTTR
jgi:hypothetical protein